ncbi:uncharacterized protein TNCT_465471 [Trichonephila clavata]|uniref:Uncharacterized protein n=1 Tax=Trichonephila clavata TaxID=2740835 RepID=A0A8X6L6V0_TRICU|nr:uncharacterized protein TNCT_465471 [Trichonephila clavata]
MASDLKIEIFAFQLFGKCLHKSGITSQIPDVSSTYRKEYHSDPENKEIYENSYYDVLYVRHILYHFVFINEFEKNQPHFECSPSYLYDYISRKCGREGMFGELTIFDLLFISCAFVVKLGCYCIEELHYFELFSYWHICWAMYFDQYKEEFYSHGGWSQLKSVPVSYDLVREFLDIKLEPNKKCETEEEKEFAMISIMKAVNNYKTFTSRINTNCKTVSKAWIKNHLQNLNRFDASSVSLDETKDQDVRDPKVIEKLLLQLKLLCNPNASEVFNVKTQSKIVNSRKQYTEEIPQSLLKLNNLNLNMTAITCDHEVKHRKLKLSLQESDCQTGQQIAIDLSRDKRNDQTDQLIGTDLFQNKLTASNTRKNNASLCGSFLKLKMTSNDLAQNETQDTGEQKRNVKTKKEIYFEREKPEVKCLLRMILVLGNARGIIRVRSSLPPLGCKSTQEDI